MEHISTEQKRTLRKIKNVSHSVKAIVYGGNKGGPTMAMQFNADVKLYGMWEALLYVEGYERKGLYASGTASEAATAALRLDDDEV